MKKWKSNLNFCFKRIKIKKILLLILLNAGRGEEYYFIGLLYLISALLFTFFVHFLYGLFTFDFVNDFSEEP